MITNFLDLLSLASSNKLKAPSKIWMKPCESLQSIATAATLQSPKCKLLTVAIRDSKDLERLSSLGHFLKGSSATLGFTKVKNECEKIQHYGHMMDETGTTPEPDKDLCLKNIRVSVDRAKKAFAVVETLMKEYYAQLEGAA